MAQLEFRSQAISTFIDGIDSLDAIAARGGPLKPIAAGAYQINEAMLQAYRDCLYSKHASNLGALLADKICSTFEVPGFVVDPVTVDEFIPEARISGVPGIERKSRSHALNIRYCVGQAADEFGHSPESFDGVVAHLGSGFSIAALQGGRMIDVNDGLLGMGPFSVERAGALPLRGVMDLLFKDRLTEPKLIELFSKKSGLQGYLGTSDFREVENLIRTDAFAKAIYDAMVYQISKEIGGMYAALNGKAQCLVRKSVLEG